MSSRPQSLDNQNTVPSKALHKAPPANYPSASPRTTKPSIPKPTAPRPDAGPSLKPASTKSASQKRPFNWFLIIGGGLIIGLLMACLVLFVGLGIIYSGDTIAPGVRAFGADVGGLSVEAAAVAIENQAQGGLILADGDRQWAVESARLGVRLDSHATAQNAYQEGRNNLLEAMLFGTDIEPVMDIDLAQMQIGLQELAPRLEQPAINAGVQLVNGGVQATPPQMGRQLDINATIAAVQQDASGILRDGQLELVMMDVQPTVMDATPMLAQAAHLLSSPLAIQGFDPIRNETFDWSLPPQVWGQWLVAETDPNSPTGLRLALNRVGLAAYLDSKDNTLDEARYLKIDEAVQAVQSALAANNLNAWVRIYHTPIQHTVRSGETLSSIAFNYGIPYGWIQLENSGVGALSVGQTVTIPSPDGLIPLPIVYNKRIVISLSQQRMWAYENGQLKWEWVVSTGIASSPTSPGVFQIQSHFDNAYAGNWDLWMPYFMGIYQPVPTLDFMNGFHGFPTRGGSQLLWTNSLGTRVTYGCILLSNTNAQLLYTWAEQGVIVDIQS